MLSVRYLSELITLILYYFLTHSVTQQYIHRWYPRLHPILLQNNHVFQIFRVSAPEFQYIDQADLPFVYKILKNQSDIQSCCVSMINHGLFYT